MPKGIAKTSGEYPRKRGNISVESIWGDPLYGLEEYPDDGDDDALDPDDAADDRFDGPSDAEDYDEDGTPLGEGADDEEERQFVDYEEDAHYENGPAINKAKIHEIRVLSRGGYFICEYRPMPWQERGDQFQVAKRADFLRVCASWMTTRKQVFLATRRLEDYFENDMKDPPLIEQKGFLERINPMLARPLPDEKKKKAFLSSLGRILPSIYLVWDDGISLPLNALFGKEAKECWEKLRQVRAPQ